MIRREEIRKRLELIRIEYNKLKDENEKLKIQNKGLMQKFSLYGVGCSSCGGREARTTKNYKPAKKCCDCKKIRML